VNIGRAAAGFAPGVTRNAMYAASSDGTIVRVNPESGQAQWRINAGTRLSAGVGADATLLAVGTSKGDVLAFDADGKPLWQAKVSSEVLSPPMVGDGVVAVWSGDGRLFGLAAADGKTKWVYQRANPPLIVRNTAGGIETRGGLFSGTAGGKLVAIDVATGGVAWESNVATPKGATELERIADVTSLPAIDERQACAVAFQGRIACFEMLRGQLNWTRDVSSLAGIVVDNRYIYVTDDKGAVQALDKATGTSVWKQDKLAARYPGGPQLVGDYVGVVDVEGYLHVIDRNDGSLVGRLATDGSAATSQPAAAGGYAVWQSVNGNLIAAAAK
jgi:outer membrane protein assembly factor BamB